MSIAERWWGFQGAKPLEAPKNLHPTVSKTGSKTDQNTWMVMHFLMCVAVQSQRKMPKGPKFRILKFLIRKMRMFILLAGQYFAKFKNKQNAAYQCQDRP